MKFTKYFILSFLSIAGLTALCANSATLEKIPDTSYSKYCDYGMCALYDNFDNVNVTNLIYRDIAYIKDTHYFKVQLNGKWGIFDLYKEKEITPIMYDDITSMKMNGGEYLAVKQDGKWAIFSARKVTELTDFIYDNFMPYEEDGIYKVKASGKVGFVSLGLFKNDKTDVDFIPAIFDDAEPLTTYVKSEIYTYYGPMYKVKQNGKWAIYDTDNKQLKTEYIYDDIKKFESGEFKGLKDGSWKTINLK